MAAGSGKGKRFTISASNPLFGSVAASYGKSARTSAPAAIGTVFKTTPPKISRVSDGIRIQHRELITEFVPGTYGDFDPTAYLIDPTSALFPWLSTMCESYEKYHFNRLFFDWEPTCPTTSGGRIQMAVLPNPEDSLPSSAPAMSAIVGATQVPPWQTASCSTDPQTLKGFRFLSRSADDEGDIKTYYVGTFLLYGYRDQTELTTPLGNVYVTYDITLKTPTSNFEGYGQWNETIVDPTMPDSPESYHMFTTSSSQVGRAVGFPYLPADAQFSNVFEFQRAGTYLIMLSHNHPSGSGTSIAANLHVASLSPSITMRNFTSWSRTGSGVNIATNMSQAIVIAPGQVLLEWDYQGTAVWSEPTVSTEFLVLDMSMIPDSDTYTPSPLSRNIHFRIARHRHTTASLSKGLVTRRLVKRGPLGPVAAPGVAPPLVLEKKTDATSTQVARFSAG